MAMGPIRVFDYSHIRAWFSLPYHMQSVEIRPFDPDDADENAFLYGH